MKVEFTSKDAADGSSLEGLCATDNRVDIHVFVAAVTPVDNFLPLERIATNVTRSTSDAFSICEDVRDV